MKQIKALLLMTVSIVLLTMCSRDPEPDPTPEPPVTPTTTTQTVTFKASEQLQQTVTLTGLKAAVADIDNKNTWVTNITPLSYGGTGAPSVLISVSENTNKELRSGVVSFKDTKQNTVILTVSQSGLEEQAYEPQQFAQSLTMAATGGEQSLTLADLTTAISSIGTPTDTWMTVTKEAYTSGSPSVKVKTEANPQEQPRTASVIITATNGDQLTLSVTQAAKEAPNYGIDDTHDTVTDQPAYSRQ